MSKLDSKIPEGPIEKKWDNAKFNYKLVNPANKRKIFRDSCRLWSGRWFCRCHISRAWL
jgi:hypothetical protein